MEILYSYSIITHWSNLIFPNYDANKFDDGMFSMLSSN